MRLLHRNRWAKLLYGVSLLSCGIGPAALLTLGDIRVGEEQTKRPFPIRALINFIFGCMLLGAGAYLIIAHLTSGVPVVPLAILMSGVLVFGGALCLSTAIKGR